MNKNISMLRKLIMIFIFFPLLLKSQQKDTISFSHIQLDSLVVSAVKKGLSIEQLLEIMQYDSTLYIAFNQLHFTNYTYQNKVNAMDKSNITIATKNEKIEQKYQNKCREQKIIAQEIDGKFQNKKGKDRFYTAELFKKLLYSEIPICNEVPKSNWKDYLYNTKEEGYLGAVKRIIFNPGTPVKLPFIGNKFALFGKEMQPYYNYAIERKIVNNEDCFVFTISVKPEFQESKKGIVVRNLITVFRRSDFQIIQRDYVMKYLGSAIKLNIKMKIDLAQIDSKTLPIKIDYNGFFKVPTKKAERIQFETQFSY